MRRRRTTRRHRSNSSPTRPILRAPRRAAVARPTEASGSREGCRRAVQRRSPSAAARGGTSGRPPRVPSRSAAAMPTRARRRACARSRHRPDARRDRRPTPACPDRVPGAALRRGPASDRTAVATRWSRPMRGANRGRRTSRSPSARRPSAAAPRRCPTPRRRSPSRRLATRPGGGGTSRSGGSWPVRAPRRRPRRPDRTHARGSSRRPRAAAADRGSVREIPTTARRGRGGRGGRPRRRHATRWQRRSGRGTRCRSRGAAGPERSGGGDSQGGARAPLHGTCSPEPSEIAPPSVAPMPLPVL